MRLVLSLLMASGCLLGQQSAIGPAPTRRPFISYSFANFPSTCTADRDVIQRSDPAAAGQSVYICNATGDGWSVLGDGTGSGTITSSSANEAAYYSGATTIIGDATFTRRGTGQWGIIKSGIGVTPTLSFLLENLTAAAAGAQQMSPYIQWCGNGWKTDATAASQKACFAVDVLPVQGSATPFANLRFSSSINNGAFVNTFQHMHIPGDGSYTTLWATSDPLIYNFYTKFDGAALFIRASDRIHFVINGQRHARVTDAFTEFFDVTATTGVTLVNVKAGAGNVAATAILAVNSNADARLWDVSSGGTVREMKGVDQASAATLTLGEGNVFHVTGTTTITTLNTCDAANSGRVVDLIFDGVLTFTDGNNLKLAGNFVTTADDMITLRCDGANWYEKGRSIN